MRMVERIAARFDFYRPTTELVIFEHRGAAVDAGFRGTVHQTQRHIEAWWPDRGPKGLCGRPPQRVTISAHMTRHRTFEGPLEQILRKRQMVWGDCAIWIEL